MLKIDRQKYLDEELHTYGSILISTMSQKLNCSEETIRRDLKEMEAQNKLKIWKPAADACGRNRLRLWAERI